MTAGSNRIAIGWTLAAICWFFAVAMLMMPDVAEEGNGIDSDGDGVDDNCDEDPYDSFWSDDRCETSPSAKFVSAGCCCFVGFGFLSIVDSGKKARDAAQTQVIYVPQQPAQQVVHHTYVQQAPIVQQQPVQRAPAAPAKTNAQWAVEARNYEVAHNWDKAAESYEQAGLFQEAGRVRQMKMQKEKEVSGVHFTQHVKAGDTYHDSVVMKDDENNQFRP